MRRFQLPNKKTPQITKPSESKNTLFSPKDNWKTFRQIEKTFAPHKPRTRSAYSDNISAGLALNKEKFPIFFKNQTNYGRLLDLFEEEILEHAARRVDLLLYVLIAYYKKETPPISGWTRLQHGKGKINFENKESLTHAAHSSFTPSLIDKTILSKIPITSTIKDANLKIKTSILCESYLMDSLNSTIELPVFVNEFEFLLEFTYQGRDKSAKIIRDVAEAKLNPIEGLLKFLQLMKSIFEAMLKDENVFTIKTSLDTQVKRRLVELEMKGTLINKLSLNADAIEDKYIYLLLRLNLNEIQACHANQALKTQILERKMLELQNEIESSKSNHVRVFTR